MSTITEIETAIEKLPRNQVDELHEWLEVFREKQVRSQSVEGWLQDARGAALSGTTTANIMALTRGDE